MRCSKQTDIPLREKREYTMIKRLYFIAPILMVFACNISTADEETRQLVDLPEMMQQHMMSNMRDHLVAINEILINMANGHLDQAAEVSESLSATIA